MGPILKCSVSFTFNWLIGTVFSVSAEIIYNEHRLSSSLYWHVLSLADTLFSRYCTDCCFHKAISLAACLHFIGVSLENKGVKKEEQLFRQKTSLLRMSYACSLKTRSGKCFCISTNNMFNNSTNFVIFCRKKSFQNFFNGH